MTTFKLYEPENTSVMLFSSFKTDTIVAQYVLLVQYRDLNLVSCAVIGTYFFTGTHPSPDKNYVFLGLISLCRVRFWGPPGVPVKRQKLLSHLQLFLQKCTFSGTSNYL